MDNAGANKFRRMSYETLIIKSEQMLINISRDFEILKQTGVNEADLSGFKQKISELKENDLDLHNRIIWQEAIAQRDESLAKIRSQLFKIGSIILNTHTNGRMFNKVYGLSRLKSLKMKAVVNLAYTINYHLTTNDQEFTNMELLTKENENLTQLLSEFNRKESEALSLYYHRKFATLCRQNIASELYNNIRKFSKIGIYTFKEVNPAKAQQYYVN